MRTARFITQVLAVAVIFGGAMVLGTPQTAVAEASAGGCSSAQIRDAQAFLRDYCGAAGGSGTIHCHWWGSYHWDSIGCNAT